MFPTKRVLLADPQALTLAGMTNILENHDGLTQVGTVTRFEQLQQSLEIHKPDILIIDYNMGGHACLDYLATLSKQADSPIVFILSAEKDPILILKALATGAPVYITKQCSEQEIKRALEACRNQEKFYCQSVLNVLLDKHLLPAPEEVESKVLTQREKEVLALLARGKQTQAVADLLYLSPHTVHTHRKSIIKKLNIKSPTEFVVRAMDLGLLTKD